MPLVLAAVGVVVVGAGLFFVLRGGDAADPGQASAVPAAAAVPVAAASQADPDKDPAAWRALPEADRKLRADMRLARVDAKDEPAAKAMYDFFMAREEKDAARKVAEEICRAKPDLSWPHVALGHEDLRELFDRCVRECQQADFAGVQCMADLQRFKKANAPKSGEWWGDAATQEKVKSLVAQVYEEEKTLGTPFGRGVAKWVVYHRSIEVMRDFPALHGTVGPYLVFVSLPCDKKGDVTLSDVKPEDLERGRKLLDDTLKVYGALYEAWHQELGPIFGFTRYGPENADEDTTMLVNVFTSQDDYAKYNGKTGGPGGGTRAYYSPQVPRFITTWDGPPTSEVAKELGEDTAQVQCHEGTHQLAHFYQWDLMRKANGGKKVDWTWVGRRPMWLEEGWAEFFAAYRKDGETYRFMQPLDDRMCDIWSIGELLKLKKWEDWRLRELLEPYHNGQLQIYGQARSRLPGDEGLAINAMANLFYGKAWSLNYFLWFHEEGGRPKYRDRFVDLMKSAYVPKMQTDPATGRQYGVPLTPADFRSHLGLKDDAAFQAFDKEWRAWEAQFLAKHKTADWERRKQVLFEKIWRLNPDGTRRKDPDRK